MIAQLQIAHNPHRDPAEAQQFVEDLYSKRRQYHGLVDENATLDREAFEQLRTKLKTESRSIKVK
jgi:hypothetical protein